MHEAGLLSGSPVPRVEYGSDPARAARVRALAPLAGAALRLELAAADDPAGFFYLSLRGVLRISPGSGMGSLYRHSPRHGAPRFNAHFAQRTGPARDLADRPV